MPEQLFEVRLPNGKVLSVTTREEADAALQTCWLLEVTCEMWQVTEEAEIRLGHVFIRDDRFVMNRVKP